MVARLPASQSAGENLGDGITPKAIWHIVKAAAKRVGIRNLQFSGPFARDFPQL